MKIFAYDNVKVICGQNAQIAYPCRFQEIKIYSNALVDYRCHAQTIDACSNNTFTVKKYIGF